MPRFAANLSCLYLEHDFLDRFAAAALDGFAAVEFAFGYSAASAEIAIDAGERGLACLPGRQDEFRRGLLERALPYALALRCPRVHVMPGVARAGEEPAALRGTFVDNLAWAAHEAAAVGVDVLIEPINTRDIPGYFLNRQDQAHAIVADVGVANLKVQMDLYHCQIVEGDVPMKLRHYLPGGRVGHIQVAGVPQRHEPDTGELYHPYLFDLIDELGYKGHIGCEYRPHDTRPGGTTAGLGWMARISQQEATPS